MVELYSNTSSIKATAPLFNISENKLSIVIVKVAGALVSPMSITNHSKCSYTVEKAILHT